ncbi:MAG TPA: hypothetical protein VMH03_00255 [Terriglobales bacterium]|nr:hypothetical protein [Terriglobales bacterium]
MTGNWAGSLTTEKAESIGWDIHPIQDIATSEDSFGLSGTIHFSDCLASGKITPATFPDGSFIMGTFVDLEIKTDAATFSFLGTADPDGLIRGNYTASGSPCDLTGTGYRLHGSIDPGLGHSAVRSAALSTVYRQSNRLDVTSCPAD